MGGRGSGQYPRFGSKERTEAQKKVDIRFLRRNGWLRPGSNGSLYWHCGDRQVGSITFRTHKDYLLLSYRYRQNGGSWENIEQAVRFDWTSCHFGGWRYWFLCPRCDRRIEVLYGAGKYFWCRHCYRLTYGSQQEREGDRMLRKAQNIREKLGVSPGDLPSFKPRNMHQKTFDKLRIDLLKYENIFWNRVADQLGLDVR